MSHFKYLLLNHNVKKGIQAVSMMVVTMDLEPVPLDSRL